MNDPEDILRTVRGYMADLGDHAMVVLPRRQLAELHALAETNLWVQEAVYAGEYVVRETVEEIEKDAAEREDELQAEINTLREQIGDLERALEAAEEGAAAAAAVFA